MEKCRDRKVSGNVLVRYKSKQLLETISGAERVTEFDVDLYFSMVEKVTVYEGGRLIVNLFDGTEVECAME